MKIAILASAAVLAAAGAAVAQEARLSDMQYVQANRCLGLASSEKLEGAADASAFATKLKEAGKRRSDAVIIKAKEARDYAKREADRAKEPAKLVAERDGAECSAYKS